MRTGVRLLVTALVVSLLVAGCSDPEAAPLPSASPTTVTPSPSATVVASPSGDYEAQARGAVAAYFEALNAALRDPATKTDALAALIDPSCTCFQAVEALRAEARQGNYFDYRYSVSNVRVQQAGALGASLTYTVHQSAGHLRNRDGRVIESFSANTGTYSVHLRRSGSTWLLDRLDQMK